MYTLNVYYRSALYLIILYWYKNITPNIKCGQIQFFI